MQYQSGEYPDSHIVQHDPEPAFDGRDLNRDKESLYPDPIDRETRCEPCEPEEAEFWSVYGHCKEGGIFCLEDFNSLPEARAFAGQLLSAWPHLHAFGVLDFCG